MKVTYLGCPGHLIVANSCRFRLHTQIGTKYRVSTVGDYFPAGASKRDTIGAGENSLFETMVFKTTAAPVAGSENCGCLEVDSYRELDCRRYSSAGAASKGHRLMVSKYARKR